MGGGAGISLHGRFRVVTDNTVYARNQTQVTFFCIVIFYLSIQGMFGTVALHIF
jgi:3-hydroxyisobutyryl-CoA hydrolase